MGTGDKFPELPEFLRREVTNKDEHKRMSEVVENEGTKPKPKAKPKAKANGAVKAAAKPAKAVAKPKAAPKATAKPAKGSEKPKAVKPAAEKDTFGLRKGSTKSQAAALYARKSGATLAEVKDAVGSIQLNVLKNLEEEGYVIEKKKESREGSRPVFRYWLRDKK